MAKRKKKQSDGYLRKDFTINGRRYCVRGNTELELLQKEIRKREEIEKGLDKVINPTLNQYYDHFTNIRRREVRESTLRSQSIQFRKIADTEFSKGVRFGDLKIKSITRKNIEYCRQLLLDAGTTPQHVNNCFSHLNHVFNTAFIDETIEKNPCKNLKQIKRTEPKVSETKHRALTTEETKKFFEVAESRNSYYINNFKVMIKTGLRIGELTALYRTDIDRKSGFIHVNKTVSRDETGAYYIADTTKTKSGSRDIPLTDEVYQIIKDQIELNRMVFGAEPSGIIFKSAENKILREYSINREIKRICVAAGVEPFTCHCFRNTFATRWIEQRPEDYKVLSEILGHKDISITLNLYTHVMQETKIKAMNDILIKTS